MAEVLDFDVEFNFDFEDLGSYTDLMSDFLDK